MKKINSILAITVCLIFQACSHVQQNIYKFQNTAISFDYPKHLKYHPGNFYLIDEKLNNPGTIPKDIGITIQFASGALAGYFKDRLDDQSKVKYGDIIAYKVSFRHEKNFTQYLIPIDDYLISIGAPKGKFEEEIKYIIQSIKNRKQ